MTQCDVCTLTYPTLLERCPNGWRPDRNGVLVPREDGKHEAARAHVVQHRTAMARVNAEFAAATSAG